MDELDRLIQAFRARARASVVAKPDVLMDIERLDDPRVVPSLVGVLADRHEATEVRRHLLEQLRNGRLPASTRPLVAGAMMQIASDEVSLDLQLGAAVAPGEFTDLPGVLPLLGSLALDVTLPIDLRYPAFTSLERVGPTTECVELLRQLSTDETLGRSVQSVLSTWHLV